MTVKSADPTVTMKSVPPLHELCRQDIRRQKQGGTFKQRVPYTSHKLNRPEENACDDPVVSAPSDDNHEAECGDNIPLLSNELKIRYEHELKENAALEAQIRLLHGELDEHTKVQKSQLAEVKRLKNDNDCLRRNVSKHTGMRKFVDVTTAYELDVKKKDDEIAKLRKEVNFLKTHINEVSKYLSEGAEASSANQAAESTSPATPNLENDSEFAQAAAAQRGLNPDTPSTSTKRKSKPGKRRPVAVGIGSSLMGRAHEQLTKRGVDCTTFTYRGADLPRLRSRVQHVIETDNAPDNVVLQGGGNDLHNGAPPHLVNKEFEHLIKEVKRVAPNTRVVLSKIPYRTFDRRLLYNIDCVNQYLENRAKRGDNVTLVDIRPDFPAHHAGPDYVHFTATGNEVYGDKLASKLINFQVTRLSNRV